MMKLWGGRFKGQLDPAAWALNASIGIDQRMGVQDVHGSQAWARALQGVGVLTPTECQRILDGLQQIAAELAENRFVFLDGDEDIHTAVERRLGELIGDLAGKLHTGRSRNDQVATDFRLWLMHQLPALDGALRGLQNSLIWRAEQDMGVVMPGYTHLQRAQPILLSHWWLAHFWPLQRDRQRLEQSKERLALLPLGAGALAGSPFPVDRFNLAKDLGFDSPISNSIDAVSDRDFAAEFLFFAAMLAVHISRLAEAVVLFSSTEFGFFELSDAYTTGSSLMPQKKNADVFELARAKSGVLTGKLTALLAVLKGLPSAYDKDLQEDKAAVFAASDTLLALLPVLAGALRTLSLNPARMAAAIDSTMLSTDLADYLVRKGIPFRQAHHLAGQVVTLAAETGLGLENLSLEQYRSIDPAFDADVYQVFDIQASLERRSVFGGTAPHAVAAQLKVAKETLSESA